MPTNETTRLLHRFPEVERQLPEVERHQVENGSNVTSILRAIRPGFNKKYNFWLCTASSQFSRKATC